jgi:Zn-dependent peptidase ImmA (M78 family)/transcriptional regulator with XRE-family HTH domain
MGNLLRLEVQPSMLRWARERANLKTEHLEKTFPKIKDWEKGEAFPTLKQLEKLAKAVRVPVGYLFLSEPVEEKIPIPDFRTIGGTSQSRPSPNLLEMIYVCQQRQDWYRDYARASGQEPVEFIGSVKISDDIEDVAAEISRALGFDLEARRVCPTWGDALRHFIGQADALGVLTMCSGVVLSNNHRLLDPNEFRGFAMVDNLAPLVFINGRDTKSAQMFTLAHELAHLWLGQSALSDTSPAILPKHEVESWCNRVAAELLVPFRNIQSEFRPESELSVEVQRLAGRFKVSKLVVLRRIFDIGGLSREEFGEAYDAELQWLMNRPKPSGGGDFYLTHAARVSRRFARGIVASTLEGQTLYRDAFRLLGIRKIETFQDIAKQARYIS